MTFHKTRSLLPSDDVARFCKPESLLLDGFRLWSQSPDNVGYIQRKFCRALGEGPGERATKAMKMLTYLIGVHAHRTFFMFHPGTLNATADERWLLGLIGALVHGQRTRAGAMVTYLLPVTCHGTVLAVAGELGRSFAAGGYELARPRGSAVAKSPEAKIRAVA